MSDFPIDVSAKLLKCQSLKYKIANWMNQFLIDMTAKLLMG